LDKKWRLIIAGSIIAIIAGIIIWQIYSYISSENSILITDPVDGKKTVIQNEPGESLKNATQEVKSNIFKINTNILKFKNLLDKINIIEIIL
jgi:hypothetical protein